MISRILLLLLFCFPLIAQAQAPHAVYIIFDASGSMWGQLPDKSHKVVVAKTVLQDFIAQDFGDTELAFRAYGHRRKGDCTDSELIAPFGPSEVVATQVQGFMETLNPLGKTPIAYSLRQALSDFGDREGEIIVITDGIETCDDDPCALVRGWQGKNVNVNVHVVGFGLEGEEKASLQCISDAAGTVYRDASSAMALAEELAEIQEAAVPEAAGPEEPARNQTVGLWLQGVNAEGEPMRVEGIFSQDGTDRFEVTSNRRNQVDAGTYDLLVGVRTANGTLYQPVTQSVSVSGDEDTVVTVKVPEPPSARARFVDVEKDEGEEQRGAQITAYQDGAEVFRFRWIDEVYLDEGTYEFRTQPNKDNELTLTETFALGDHKELVFEMQHTVHATFAMRAEGSGTKLRGNYELWQDGEKAYDVHTVNGADILPGTYEVRLVNDLNPHIEQGVVVTAQDTQTIEITVPVGYITFIYQQADGTRDADKRVFLARQPDKRGRVKQSGERHALIPGTYTVRGWRGAYDEIVFEVEAGQERDIVLRNKE